MGALGGRGARRDRPDASIRTLVEALEVAARPLNAVRQNAAIMLHDEGADADEVLEYLQRWALVSEQRARQMLRFMSDPLWRAYTSTYVEGERLLRPWLAARPAGQSAMHRFQRLLDEPLTPADDPGGAGRAGRDDCRDCRGPGGSHPFPIPRRCSYRRGLMWCRSVDTPVRAIRPPSATPERPPDQSDEGEVMTGTTRLLVVDDEPSLQDIVATSMRFLGYQVNTAATGREAVKVALADHPDLLILDVMLPDFDGIEVMRRIREAGLDSGVVFLSARDTPADKIAGLTAGGDDYVTKPFGLEELAARVSAVLRRVRPDNADGSVMRVSDLELDEETYEVRRAGQLIELAPTEYKLLRHLMVNANVVLSRAQLLDAVWGTDFYGDDSVVATYISYLRRKIDAGSAEPLLYTHRGFGYVLRGTRQ